MVRKYLFIALALALSGCAASTAKAATNAPPTVAPTTGTQTVPEQGYLLAASDNSWLLFIQVQNGQGTADSAIYETATDSVSVQHGTASLSNGILSIGGISNISWFSGGCDCQYQAATDGGLVVSISTTTGIEQWSAVATDASTYNAGVSALNAEADTAVAASAAAANAAAQAQASASAAAATAAHDVLAKEQATCQRNAGTAGSSFGTFTCTVGYRSPSDGQTYQYDMAFDAKGNVVPETCEDDGYTEGNCGTTNESAQQARTDCLDGSYNAATGYWHPATDICSE